MGLFSRKKPEPARPAPTPQPAPTTRAPDFSQIDTIRAEWPPSSLDPVRDREQYQQALALFERDDYPAMMQCATLFARALAHSLYGEGILRGDDIPETVHKALYCSLCAPPDGRTLADSAQRAARLAMIIMRENGWHPPAFGGTQSFFEPMMTDKGNYLLLTAVVAPPDQPWAGDLKQFFAVPPTPVVGRLPDPDAERAREAVGRLFETVQESKEGDVGSTLFVDGMALAEQGDREGALTKYTQAATHGSVQAMAAAGDLTRDLGQPQESFFWYESAANAGHPIAMFNVAIVCLQQGSREAALQWFEKAAGAGNIEGFAALTQLADESGDEAAETHWARLGAQAGHTFCMARHGLLLARSANGDVPSLRCARDFIEQAADRGDVDSMTLAVSINQQLGDPGRVQRFVQMVVQSGDSESIDRLRRFGVL